MLWEELRQDEFQAAIEKSNKLCILPIGCVESHGIHLPLGCDTMHVYHQCKLAAEKEPAVVFPPLYFGEKAGAGEYPGTIIFHEKLIFEILEACCKEIHRNGFKKILIITGHGGNNTLLNSFARSTIIEKNGYLVFTKPASLKPSFPAELLKNIEKYPYLTNEDIKILEDYGDKIGGHGCFTETGWVYDTRPDLVRLDLMNAKDGRSRHVWDKFREYDLYSPFGWNANYPDSLDGDYHEGMNERIARTMTEAVVDHFAEIFGFLKTETISDEFYDEWAAKNPLL